MQSNACFITIIFKILYIGELWIILNINMSHIELKIKGNDLSSVAQDIKQGKRIFSSGNCHQNPVSFTNQRIFLYRFSGLLTDPVNILYFICNFQAPANIQMMRNSSNEAYQGKEGYKFNYCSRIDLRETRIPFL